MISEKESRLIYILKGIAVLSIISAHCGLPLLAGKNTVHIFLKAVITWFGYIGVPVFFVLSGYLFKTVKNKYELLNFWKKKIFNLIIPWFFCAVIVWLYHYISGDFSNIIKYILGLTHNPYWYMPVLICYFFLFQFLSEKSTRKLVFIILIAIHIIIFELSLFDKLKEIEFLNNMVNFVPFFVFGLILQEENFKVKVAKMLKNMWTIVLSIFILLFIIIYSNKLGLNVGYESSVYLLYTICTLILVYNISLFVYNNLKNSKIYDYIVQVGKDSFFIYLIHQPIAGILSNLISRNYFTGYLIIALPIIVVFIIECVLCVLRKINERNKIDFLFSLVGIKK